LYIGLSLPEGVTDNYYFLEEGKIVEKSPWTPPTRDVVLAVPIEEYVDSDLYHSRTDIEAGLQTLRFGVQVATTKWALAGAAGSILGLHDRNREAIEFLSIAIDQGPNYLKASYYSERALAYKALGALEESQDDLKSAELAKEAVKRQRVR
jgi:hypothetical protein